MLWDPFTRLRWQKTIRAKPDPFTPEERDVILEFYRVERPRREILLLPEVVKALRSVDHPSDADANTYFFRKPDGGPVTTTWWPKKSWHPVLKKLGIRRRKFYATRHSFIENREPCGNLCLETTTKNEKASG